MIAVLAVHGAASAAPPPRGKRAPRPRPTPEQALWGEAPVTYGPPA